MKFDPNKINKKQEYVWGTFIPDRSPAWKIHATQNQATSALKYRSEYLDKEHTYTIKYVPETCTLWKLIDNEWIEINFKREYDYHAGEKLL